MGTLNFNLQTGLDFLIAIGFWEHVDFFLGVGILLIGFMIVFGLIMTVQIIDWIHNF